MIKALFQLCGSQLHELCFAITVYSGPNPWIGKGGPSHMKTQKGAQVFPPRADWLYKVQWGAPLISLPLSHSLSLPPGKLAPDSS